MPEIWANGVEAVATERRVRFVAEAKAVRDEMIDTGQGLEADEVHSFLKAKIEGRKIAKPKARSWRA